MSDKSKESPAGGPAESVKPGFPGALPYGWALPAVIIITIGTIAFANSFGGAFVFDDNDFIVNNPNIRSLHDIWYSSYFIRIPRPLIQFSLAVNYALGGLDPWWYHLFNLSIHLLTALTLFGIVRRTLCLPALRRRFSEASRTISMAVALIWTVHPLQTQAVTYISQRCESFMSLFYLLTLYCVIRGFSSHGRQTVWFSLSILSCGLGMLAKEVMVTAPLVCLLYDYFFLGGSLSQALRLRKALYVGLFSAWGILILNLFASYSFYAEILSGATGAMSSPWRYLLTQFGVISHYLRLAIWPSELVLDYYWPPAETAAQILPSALLIFSILAGTVGAFWRRYPAGFLGCWFFLILSVTSSVFPTGEPAFEHRMYLPLAAVVCLAVTGVYLAYKTLSRRLEAARSGEWCKPLRIMVGVLLAVVVAALGLLTAMRNRDYRSELAIWSDTVAKQPRNARAQGALGVALDDLGKTREAIIHYEQALQLTPEDAKTHHNLGNALYKTGRPEEAAGHFEEALRLDPYHPEYHRSLGIALQKLGRLQEALRYYRASLGLEPGNPGTHYSLGLALAELGNEEEALRHFESALRLEPENARTHLQKGIVLLKLNEPEDALSSLKEAVRLDPGLMEAHNNLGVALCRLARFEEARPHFEEVLRLDPLNTTARRNLDLLRNMLLPE